MSLWLKNILRFIILFLLQVLLVNNMHILGVCSPSIYLLFLLLLPATLPRWTELLIGFAVGLIMDIFCNTLGAHAAACTAFCYLRPLLIKNMIQENERLTDAPDVKTIGWNIFVKMTVLLTLLHHTILFSLLSFTTHLWWLTLIQIIVSSLVTIILIFCYELVS